MNELKDIPKHWQEFKLYEIGKVINGDRGKNYPSRAHYVASGIPFISAGNIEKNFIDTNNLNFITEEKFDTLNSGKLKDGDIIYCLRGSLGKCSIFNLEKGAISSSLCILRLNDDVIGKFVYYYLCSPFGRDEILKHDNGTAQPNLSAKNFSNFIIFKPPLPEQEAIVSKIEELLSDLENGKQQLQTAQQQLKVYRQSLLKWAFEGKLCLNYDSSDLYDENDLEKENKNHINHANHKNHSSDNLPKWWKWVKLGEVCSNVEYGSATKSKKVGKVPVLRMGNIQNGKFDWDDLVFTDDKEEIQKYLLKKNDVLFNRTNSAEWVGKTAQYKGERPAIFAGYLIRINRIETLIDATYLTYYLNTHAAKQYGNTVRSFGVNQSNINGTKLKIYPIPLPPLKEQQLIVQELESKLTVCDKIEETISQSLQQAETLRQSILKKAFEGKLV